MFTLAVPAGQTTPQLWYAMTTISIEGGESELSNVITQKYDYKENPKVPGAPTLVTIRVTCDNQCTVQLVK